MGPIASVGDELESDVLPAVDTAGVSVSTTTGDDLDTSPDAAAAEAEDRSAPIAAIAVSDTDTAERKSRAFADLVHAAGVLYNHNLRELMENEGYDSGFDDDDDDDDDDDSDDSDEEDYDGDEEDYDGDEEDEEDGHGDGDGGEPLSLGMNHLPVGVACDICCCWGNTR